MDEMLVELLGLTFEGFLQYLDIARTNVSAEFLVARLEAKRDFKHFEEAEEYRIKVQEQCSRCQKHLRTSYELLRAHAKYLARKNQNPNDKQVDIDVVELRQRLAAIKAEPPTSEPSESTPASDRRWGYRFACPDGTVLYGVRENCDAIGSALTKIFGKKAYHSSFMYLNEPDPKYVPEMRALYETSTGFCDIPTKIENPPKRWRCIYRIASPDGLLHFADGGVAYDRLHSTLRQKYKIRKCEIAAVPTDRIPSAWLTELKRLHGTPDGGYKIPFPPEPPKRQRRKHTCPSCGSPKVFILQGTKAGYDRECRSCDHHFTTPK